MAILTVLLCVIANSAMFLAGWSLGRMWRGIDGRHRTVRKGSTLVSNGYVWEREQ